MILFVCLCDSYLQGSDDESQTSSSALQISPERLSADVLQQQPKAPQTLSFADRLKANKAAAAAPPPSLPQQQQQQQLEGSSGTSTVVP